MLNQRTNERKTACGVELLSLKSVNYGFILIKPKLVIVLTVERLTEAVSPNFILLPSVEVQ